MRTRAIDEDGGGDALERAVEADIRAELAAHLELAAEALEAQGLAPEEARRLAGERFGDLERTVRACRRARLGGRIVMQRMNLVATLALLVAVLFFGLRSLALMEHVAARAAALDERVRALEATPAAPKPIDALRVGVGDLVEVLDRRRERDFGEREVVAADGQILLADLGWVEVAGLTREELSAKLNAAYRAHYQDLVIDVRVTKARPGAPPLVAPLRLWPGDRVEIVSTWHPGELDGSFTVAPDGTILLRDIGHLEVAGLSRAELEQRLNEAYAPYYDELELRARVLPAE